MSKLRRVWNLFLYHLRGLFGVVLIVLSFGLAGCASSGEIWSKGLREKREATVCGKEVVQVLERNSACRTQPEYRIQLTWDDPERGTHPMLWSVVSEKAYQVLNISDKVLIVPGDFGQMKGHVTVLYYWTDNRVAEINDFKYEYDLPEDPYPR